MKSQPAKQLDIGEPYVIEYFIFARSKDGSPVRWIANGHRTNVVGLTPLNKCRHLGLPWESRDVELVVLKMLGACARVADVVSQPLSLFFGIRGIKRQFRYTPDISVWVHHSFRDELVAGRPLYDIVAKPFQGVLNKGNLVELTLELKSDADDVEEVKWKMINAIYAHVRRDLFLLKRGEHIDSRLTRVIKELELAAHDRIGPVEKARCSMAFGQQDCVPFGLLGERLGGQPFGERLVKALHFKDLVSIDLRTGLHALTPVWIRRGE